jgi:hypothetical protein
MTGRILTIAGAAILGSALVLTPMALGKGGPKCGKLSHRDQFVQGHLHPDQEEGQAGVHQGLPLEHPPGLQEPNDVAADRVLALGRIPRLISWRRRACDAPGATTTMTLAASSTHAGRRR